MKSVAVVGQTNVGKTSFCLNFAAFLGLKTITINFSHHERGCYTKTFSISEAQSLLVSEQPHQTRDMQSMVLTLPWGKGEKQFELIDTAGLTNSIHHEEDIRKAMAHTLRYIRQAEIILHILDSARIMEVGLLKGIGEIDYQIAQFGQLKPGYVILANKMDLPHASEGLEKIKQEFPGNRVIGVSAVTKYGFKEVKSFVKQHL